MDSLLHLPGGDLVEQGLRDLASGQTTVESCLVKIISPALVRANLLPAISEDDDTEITLYHLLEAQASNPYSMYNSLLERVTSFQKSLFLSLK